MARILVVDDHAITREPLARVLRMEGYEAASASNGLEALAAMRVAMPDLVLLDLMMPKMDGVALLTEMRNNPLMKAIPVILLTGMPEGSSMARARALQVQEIIPKAQFTVEELLRRIRACLQPLPRQAAS